MPTLNALLHLSLLMWFNLLTLVLLVEFLMGISLIDFKSVSIVLATVLSLSVLLINYFGLVYGSRKQNIIDQYSDENDEKKRKGDFVLGWYIGLTVLAFVLSLITKIK